MSRINYFDVMKSLFDKKITEKQKDALFKISQHLNTIDFWKQQKNIADYHIKRHAEIIAALREKHKINDTQYADDTIPRV